MRCTYAVESRRAVCDDPIAILGSEGGKNGQNYDACYPLQIEDYLTENMNFAFKDKTIGFPAYVPPENTFKTMWLKSSADDKLEKLGEFYLYSGIVTIVNEFEVRVGDDYELNVMSHLS